MDEVQELLAEYGQWVADDTVSVRDQAQQLAGMVAGPLRRTLPAPAVQVSQTGAVPAVFFDFEGRDYLVSCTVDENVVTDGTISRIVRDAGLSGPGDTRWALLSWTQESRQLNQLIESVRGFGAVLDRAHLDAAVAGLLPLADLIHNVFRRREPHLPLAELVFSRTPLDLPLTMTAADRLTTPLHGRHRPGAASPRTWPSSVKSLRLSRRAWPGGPVTRCWSPTRMAWWTLTPCGAARGGSRPLTDATVRRSSAPTAR
ncbi:hypothetical protein ACWDCO_17595 [Streptomyces albogriseolus]